MIVFFVDTNLFLQCKELTQIPWDTISKDQEILLLISRPVQGEIDKLKHNGNNRRAKITNTLFRKLLQADENSITIKKESPKVSISFSPVLKTDDNIHETLDLTKSDDNIIAEAINYSRKYHDSEVFLLTHDTNPMLTANRCGLSYEMIPDEWLLPPEAVFEPLFTL